MRFSTKAEYGLRSMVALARNYPEKKSVKEISLEEKISVKYLERLMGEIRKRGLVESTKGKDGGYALTRAPKKIAVGELIEILEGPIETKCESSHCRNMKNCSSSLVWVKLESQIRKTLYAIKLSDLIK